MELKTFESPVYKDKRGYLTEIFNTGRFDLLLYPCSFVSDKVSFSKKGVLRGMHYQKNHPQAKMLIVLYGKIQDVVINLNTKEFSVFELKENEGIFIPKHYAHGFLALEDSLILYKCDEFRYAEDECGIMWNEFPIPWENPEPFLSEKDKNWRPYKEIAYDP